MSKKSVGMTDMPTFIPTEGHKAWTLFLAGQTLSLNPRIVFRCVQCAKDKAADRLRTRPLRDCPGAQIGDFSVLIGYFQSENAADD